MMNALTGQAWFNVRATGRRDWYSIVFSVFFAVLLLFVPWEQLAGRPFEDREVYFDTFLYQPPIIEDRSIASFHEFFFNEALWDLAIRSAMSDLGIGLPLLFGGITFACLFCFSHFLVSRHGAAAALLLVNPMVIDFAFSQLRMAASVSLVLLALTARRRLVLGAIIALACFIHTAMLLFILMYLVAVQMGRRLRTWRASPWLVAIVAIGGGMLIALLAGPLRETLLSSVGDRRAEYTLAAVSLSYASLWMGLMLLAPLQNRSFFSNDTTLFSVACIATFVFTTLLGVYGARFVAATYPVLMSAVLDFRSPTREMAVLAFLFYTALQWHYWFQ